MENENVSTNLTDNLRNEHPLLNSVVLKEVFQYLNPTANLATLKTLRQVCTVWRDVSLSLWRKTAVLQLYPDRREPFNCPPYLVTTFTWLMFQLQNPVNCYRFGEHPFHQYKLEGTTIDIVYAFEQGTKANAFWHFLGVHVQHLIIDHVTFLGGLSSNCRQDLVQFLIHFFPNLKTLTVKLVEFQERKEGDVETKDFLALTPVLSSVVSLKIDGRKCFKLDNFPNLKNLTFLENDIWLEGTKPAENLTVTNLTVNFSGSPSFQRIQRSPRFKLLALQNLSVRLPSNLDSIFHYLPNLLLSHGETLKTLQVEGWPLHEPYYKFPFKCQLDHLTELSLWGNVANDLGFLRWTPKLKVLQWDLYCLEKQEELQKCYDEEGYTRPIRHDIVEEAMSRRRRRRKMAQVKLPDLEHLQINCGFGINSLKKLGEWMPNVKTLKIVLWQGSISVIGNQWPLMEHLVGLHGSTIRDEDVIGNGEGKCLLDLQLLKTFHVHSTCNEGLLTDVVVDSVFLKMGHLKDLQFCASPQFSGEAEARLNDRIPMVKVIRNYTTNNKEHVNWECCKNAEFMQLLQENARPGNYSDDGGQSDSSSEESVEDDDASESDSSEAESEEDEQQE